MRSSRSRLYGWAVFAAMVPVGVAVMSIAEARTLLNFNSDWGFWRGEKPGAEKPGYDDSGFARITLPHTMRLETKHCGGAANVYQGIGWYRRYFTVPDEFRNQRVVLDFEGVMIDSTYYLNGEEIGTRNGGYIGFSLDITDKIKWGESNVLAVRVSNRDNPDTPPGKPLANLDFHYYGGIYRDVAMKVTDKLHITDPLSADRVAGGGVFVTYPSVSEEVATVHVRTHVKNDREAAAGLKVRTLLKDADGRIVARGETPASSLSSGDDRHFEQKLDVPHPHLWDTKSPYLYTLVSEIVVDGRPVDVVETRIGIRTIAFKPDGFYLNGKKLYLRGANRHQSYQNVGDAAPNSMQRRDALQIRDNGFNFVRATHYPQDPAFLDACDELGLLVIECQPGWQFFGKSRTFYDRTHRDTREMIRRDRNRPSVILWETSLNETGYSEQWARESTEIAHAEYPGNQMYTAADYGYHGKYYDACYKVVDCSLDGVQKDFNPDKPFLTREWGDWGHQSLRKQGEALMLDQVHARQDQLNGRGYPDWGGLDANKRIAGYCLWSWNDYARGSASVTLGSGAVDIDRFGKYSAYWLETMQPARDPQYGPKVFVASTNSPDSSLDVDVFSNCDSVKFYRNGKFVGEQTREEALKACPHIGEKGGSPIFRFSLSGYEAGELKAEAYLDGKLVKTHAVSTPGNPARVVVEPDLKGIAPVADGSDLIPVHVKVVDAEGTVVPGFKGNVRVGVEGAGALVGGKMPRIRVENQQPDGGIGFFFAKTGNSPGKLILKASSDGLEAGEAVVETLPFTGRFVPGPEPRWTRSEADLEDKAELFLNLAAGCPVTVSSAQEQNPAAAVTDEDEGSRWTASDGSFPQTVEIDLKAPASMSAVEIIWENPLAYVFRLETSGDRKTWFPAAEGKAVQGRSLSPVRTHARYVRVVVTGVEGEAGWASIREIRVRPLGEGEELSPGEPVPNADVVCLTASAPSEPDRGTDKLRDGETVIGSGWLSASSECPQSVTMEFKSPQTLTGSRIYWEKDSSQYTYDMEVSSDGKNWNKVMDQRQVAGQYFKPEFFPVPVKNVRYVRVTLTQVNSGAGVNKIGMAEWILYRQPGI